MIDITVKGFAKFMTTANASHRHKVLRDYKFPEPEGQVQAIFYEPARRAIKGYHVSSNGTGILSKAIVDLRLRAKEVAGASRRRLLHNSDAINGYLRHFANPKLGLQPIPRLSLQIGGVQIKASPDLFLSKNGKTKIVKLELTDTQPNDKQAQIITQIVFEACLQSGIQAKPKDVEYWHIRHGQSYKGAKTRTRLKAEIEAACAEIEALWPTIQKSKTRNL